MSKYIKKIFTAIWALLLVTMFGLLAAFGVTQIPAAQRFAARRAAAGLADALGVPVSIERLRFVPFSTLEVAGVVVCDSDSVPMISARRIKADVSVFSLVGGNFGLREVEADSISVLLVRKPGGGLNIAALASGGGQSHGGSSAPFSIRRIKAQRCEVRYDDGNSAPVVLESVSLDASGLRKSEAGCGVSIADFSFFIPSFKVHFAMGGDFALSGDTVSVGSAHLSLGDCAASVDTAVAVVDSLGLQMARVMIPKASLNGSTASLFLGRPLPDVSLSLNASFESNKLSVNHLRLSAGESSSLAAHGLAKVSRAGRRLRFERANLSVAGWLAIADVKAFADPEGVWPDLPALPFDCSLTATATDASVGFNVDSESGTMRLYANASSSDGWDTSDFNVQLDADLTPSAPAVGPLTRLVARAAAGGRLALHAQGADVLRYATLNGGVQRVQLGNMSFGGVRFDGVADSRGFDGSLKVADPLGRLTLIAESQWGGVSPFFSVTARADSVKLGVIAPGVVSPDRLLGFKARVETSGTDLRTSTSSLLLSDFYLNSDTDQVAIEHLTADLATGDDGLRRLSLVSDVASVTASGNFDLAGLGRELRSQAAIVMPALSMASERRASSPRAAAQHADFEARLFGIDPLVRAFVPQLHLPDTVSLRGRVDSHGNMAWAQLRTSRLAYSDFSCSGLDASVVGNDGRANLTVQADGANIPFIGPLPDARIDASAEHDRVTADVLWDMDANRGNAQGFMSLDAMVARSQDGRKVWNVGIDRSSLPLADGSWTLDSCRMSIADNRVDVQNFRAFSGRHSVHAFGTASDSPADTMWLSLDNIVLEDLIHTDASSKFSLAGDLSLRMAASALLGSPSFSARAGVDRLFVDGDKLEHLDVSADFQAQSDTMALGLAIVTGGRVRATADGFYCLKSGELSIPFAIDSLSTGFLNFYLDNCIDSWKGTTSGRLSIYGPTSDLKLVAELKMNDDNSFRVKQTDVTYYIKDNDSLSLSPSSMDFHNIRFADAKGRKGKFYGSIRHDMFSGLDVDLGFDVDNMALLQTNASESPTYYGDIFGSGRMFIKGRTSNINVFIDARTDKSSSFTVAPNAKSDLSNADFILFDSEPVKEGDLADILGTGTSATLKLHITPDAKISVVIDPKTGNQLTGRGIGDLTVEVERTGALAMHGSYAIEDGSYNFAFSVFDKQFSIDKGSSIYWDGGPYDATVNIAATYLVKASINSLVSGTSYDSNADLKRRVPVKCKIFLTGKLTQPDIRFGIEIPSSQNFNQYAFDQYVNTQEEVSRQVFALLTSGQFYALQEAGQQNGQSQNYLGQTASELLSNKLSSMFSNNDRNIGIGVNYRPGDEVSNEEYEVAISTQAFDNKVLLSGNIGYGRDASGSSSDDGTLIGDFDVEVKLNRRGNIRAKAYTHSNNDVIYETSPTTQGVGVSFQEEFDSFRELFRSYWRRLFRRKHAKDSGSTPEKSPEAEPVTGQGDAQ